MHFTMEAYRDMLNILSENDYQAVGYSDAPDGRSILLRHDIDLSLTHAYKMAVLENEVGVTATYFFLINSTFYNVCNPDTIRTIHAIHDMGHDVGLHFDETGVSPQDVPGAIIQGCRVLSDILSIRIGSFSMHRPSAHILQANLDIPGLINAYSDKYLHSWKYLSDSRRNWREDPISVIRSGEIERLHILTHPFWYEDSEISLQESLTAFCKSAVQQRYLAMNDNIRDLHAIIPFSMINNQYGGAGGNPLQDLLMRGCHSQRLSMKALKLLDAEDMFLYTSQESTCTFMRWGPHKRKSETILFLHQVLNQQKNPDNIVWGIYLPTTTRLIGAVRIYKIDMVERKADISYILNGDYTGNGYMTECILHVMDVCAKELGLRFMYADVVDGNIASQKVMGRCGMSQIDHKPQRKVFIKGREYTLLRFGKEVIV